MIASTTYNPVCDPLTPEQRGLVERIFQPIPTRSARLGKPLTERQCEIMALLALGYSRREVAAWLGVSRGLIDQVVRTARFKLTGHTR